MISGRVLLWLFLVIAVELAASVALVGAGEVRALDALRVRERNLATAAALELTSLALWSEPLYCRHPAEAEPFAAFSDHPAALEHFPAGSFVPPSSRAPAPSSPDRLEEPRS